MREGAFDGTFRQAERSFERMVASLEHILIVPTVCTKLSGRASRCYLTHYAYSRALMLAMITIFEKIVLSRYIVILCNS